MKTITGLAPAKLNLGLDIVGVRPDEYHELETVFQSISIYDKLIVTLDETSSGLSMACDTPQIPCDSSNLVWKAAKRFQVATGIFNHIHVQLEKYIPLQAGLGGGSSDAAAMLRLLQDVYADPLSEEALAEIAVSLGADVPFLLHGGTAYAQGIGEQLEQLSPFRAAHLVVAKGEQGVSTNQAYRNIDALSDPMHPQISALRSAIQKKRDVTEIALLCDNLFEQATNLPEVQMIQEIMLKSDALCSVMTGSGAAVFGIFLSDAAAENACTILRQADICFVEKCETIASV
ncbi:MAG: 4-(cytidine 5'-diphospho)-2-C-methyl-D-erythritol kinase [Ruminococcus sp.]|nr:4-(cytidine 5'-diphospho)-2-C-methyl-D-erythritol kinase [Ruminococcus sp.]